MANGFHPALLKLISPRYHWGFVTELGTPTLYFIDIAITAFHH